MTRLDNHYIFISFALLLVASCGKSDSDDLPSADITPNSAQLVVPLNNTECTSGIDVNATESSVEFLWESAENANSYELVVTNLTNGETATNPTFNTGENLTLKKATPYEWFVISKAKESDKQGTSEKWKFYNAGSGTINYAPFPADLLKPEWGSTYPSTTTQIVLEWTATDVDNDIESYQVFYGVLGEDLNAETANSNALLIDVQSGFQYEWKILVKDKQNNVSESETFVFSID